MAVWESGKSILYCANGKLNPPWSQDFQEVISTIFKKVDKKRKMYYSAMVEDKETYLALPGL